MKKEAKQYSAEEKTKIALEALRGELTYAKITSKYGAFPLRHRCADVKFSLK
jgi:hypothetical protein